MICWLSVLESGRERNDFSFAYNGCRSVIYESLRPIAMQSNHDAKPNIVDAPLTLILPRAYSHYGTIHFRIVYQ
jgi:hypothetical protein